ncbi:hypothetical protein FEM48_Zijuj11G0012600 [Ziziphus jujuba var. spinosa]|uniref:Pseudouridine synthase RsuA/RluA-like domain-containing protein n=1 Tax=Ziziphus jujuba var. spinosa TaxID=714518 RepID=A0A978UG03_ZIZJJ|nr:hypothetical protein FEM48_Zijuj11G0012600 [Ziziphus jujuba var. spinosa]
MRKTIPKRPIWLSIRKYSRISPPPPVNVKPVIRVSNNVARLGCPKEGPKPRQLLSLPPFPGFPLPGKNMVTVPGRSPHVTAISWVKYYFYGVNDDVIQSHFNKGLVHRECSNMGESIVEKEGQMKPMREVKPSEVMKVGDRVHVPVSVAESRISRRFDTIPSGTLYPNADEIKYLQRLVKYRDWAIIVLNKPPRLPVKGHLPIHNSMDALAAAALSYGYNEGPKLVRFIICFFFFVPIVGIYRVHRLDRESSGLIIMGRTKESIDHLNWLFSNYKEVNTPHKAWNDACEATYQKYWALVIGSPKEKEGLICAPLSKVLLDDGKTERVILAHQSGFEPSQKAITEYRVLGPMINGCSWVELRPHTSRKHQIEVVSDCSPSIFLKLRVHCAEALGTPIVGDYKYGWFVHRRWKQMPRVDIEPTTGKPYKLRRPDGLDVQKGSVLSKVPLLHLHCRELVLPNIAKFLKVFNGKSEYQSTEVSLERDVLRFVASMPSHMKISWNLMSSYLV